MTFPVPAHTPYQWQNAPSSNTPLDAAHLIAAEQDIVTYVQQLGALLGVGPTSVKTGAYTASPGDLVPCDCSSAGFTVTLPTAPPDGSTIVVMVVNGANSVGVIAGGSDGFNFAGGASPVLKLGQTLRLQYSAGSAIWYGYKPPVTLGSDGTVGGPGGTPLTNAVVSEVLPLWQPSTVYAVGQQVAVANQHYVSLTAHTSGATFSGVGTNWKLVGQVVLADLPSSLAFVSPVLVAPSNASAALKKVASYVCSGTNDDLTIGVAVAALATGVGTIELLPGDYYFGSGAANYVNVVNAAGGVTIKGTGRRQSSVIHVPAGSAAPCAIRMAAVNGSHVVRDLYIVGDGVQSTSVHGVLMQCNEPQVLDSCVSGIGGTGFILDSHPGTVGAATVVPTVGTNNSGYPGNTTFSGQVRGCEAYACGQAILNGGGPGDGFWVTAGSQNAAITDCFVGGGSGTAAALTNQSFVQGSAYTTITVTPLTQAINAGDLLLIGNTSTYPHGYQIVTASASAAYNATSISVNSFTASATTAGASYIVDITKMVTRTGFQIQATTHLSNCHPYFCHQTGLYSQQCPIFVMGGEYETNGWNNIYCLGSTSDEVAPGVPVAQGQIIGVNTYGNPANAHIGGFAMRGFVISNNYIEAGNSNSGMNFSRADYSVISNNVVIGGMTSISGQSFGISVTGNTVGASLIGNIVRTVSAELGGGTYTGLVAFNVQNTLVADNNCLGVATGNKYSIGGTLTGTIAKTNAGYNPVGVVSPAVPSSGSAVAATAYDRTFYVTNGAASSTFAIGGGPTITLPASATGTIRVPAGTTLTPNYTAAPTWVVEGE